MKTMGFPSLRPGFEETRRMTNPDHTSTVTFRHLHGILTVTYNRPSSDALDKFVLTWQEILWNLVDLPATATSHQTDCRPIPSDSQSHDQMGAPSPPSASNSLRRM